MAKIKTLNDLKPKGLSGKWQLDNRHRLTVFSQEDKEQIELEASLIDAEADALVVSVTQKKDRNKTVTSIARINGTWRADDRNQLEFEVEGQRDRLKFTGSWKVNENNEIVYSYRTRSKKTLQTLTFKGYWDLTEKNRLTYLIEGDTESAFRFKGAFQTTSILAKKGELKYQVGVEAKGKREKLKTITLFGKWRIGQERQVPAALSGKILTVFPKSTRATSAREAGPMRRALVKATSGLELSFEMEYSDGEKRELRFGAEYNFNDDFSVAAQLIQKSGDPLGVEVILSKEFLKSNAKAFIRLKKTLRESAAEAGVSMLW